MIVVTIMAKVADRTPTITTSIFKTKPTMDPKLETMKMLESSITTLVEVEDHHRNGD
jgi:hypothetical protein